MTISTPRAARALKPADDQPTPVERSYLEVISYLAARREPVIAAQLARWMRVRPPTVTHVVQRLEQKGLIVRDPAGAIALTPSGCELAEQVVRRHRLLERFLYDHMQIPWHEVHREATMLEAAISPALEERIAAMVGDKPTCPHGNPIPGQGEPTPDDVRLITVQPGAWFVITRIDEEAGEDSCTLQLLWARGLLPGTPLVRLPDAHNGIAVRRADRRVLIGRRVAGLIWGTTSELPVE
jgi:DtxR family Mn-dependent transcriptional regulator